MSRLANANKRAKVIKALLRAGFSTRLGGKHTIVVDADGTLVSTMPNAREINPTTLRAILKQCGLRVDDYLDLY